MTAELPAVMPKSTDLTGPPLNFGRICMHGKGELGLNRHNVHRLDDQLAFVARFESEFFE